MAGSVWQWTASLYKAYPNLADDGRNDPTVAGSRVLRGGSCVEDPSGVRGAVRGVMDARCRATDTEGFRCVRDSPQQLLAVVGETICAGSRIMTPC